MSIHALYIVLAIVGILVSAVFWLMMGQSREFHLAAIVCIAIATVFFFLAQVSLAGWLSVVLLVAFVIRWWIHGFHLRKKGN